eukprot:TRINITY_DN43962_c0_g2_i1.p1 TRINITY_DN43962_c0_g2~~TRINITY_DN43962_c0_g2_i1.p1  ORF type:complete len:207 (-),score=11.83 TRINITY_DN43962_c0_g2_i1:289-909(-)
MAPKHRKPKKLQQACAKTRLCRYYTEEDASSCRAGEKCLFAHSVEELCQVPDLSGTRLCRLYAEGSCEAGANCIFAHGEHALRKSPAPQAVAGLQSETGRPSAACSSYYSEQTEDLVRVPHGSQSSPSPPAIPLPRFIIDGGGSRPVDAAGSSHRGHAQSSSFPLMPCHSAAPASNNAEQSLLVWPGDEQEIEDISETASSAHFPV